MDKEKVNTPTEGKQVAVKVVRHMLGEKLIKMMAPKKVVETKTTADKETMITAAS